MNGMCFPYALKRVMDDEELILVHGLYVGEHGVAAHAWVENDGLVWDWQSHCRHLSTDYCGRCDEDGDHPDDCDCRCDCLTNLPAGEPRWEWYGRNVAIAQSRFSQDEALRHCIDTGHYGPWIEPCFNCGSDLGMEKDLCCLECGETS